MSKAIMYNAQVDLHLYVFIYNVRSHGLGLPLQLQSGLAYSK